jgi:hypothetical protein
MLLGKRLGKIVGSKFSDFLFGSWTSNKSYPFGENFNPKTFTAAEKFKVKIDPSKNLNQSVPSLMPRFFRTTEMWLKVEPSYHTLKKAWVECGLWWKFQVFKLIRGKVI